MRLVGWRFEGAPPNLAKMVMVVAPHTSNWDFLVGIMAMFALDLRISWLAKNTMFRKPFYRLMRWMGGVPLDRSSPQGVVATITEAFQSEEQLILGLSPEGTRSAVSSWRSGFWRIAKAAEVPIVMVYFDFARRVVGFADPFNPTDDFDTDLAFLKNIVADVTPQKVRSISPAT